jgi:tetratricopeptide (TPR) repeat protein
MPRKSIWAHLVLPKIRTRAAILICCLFFPQAAISELRLSANKVFRLSLYLISIDRYSEAEESLLAMRQEHETDRVNFELARVYYLQGRHKEADQLLDQLIADSWRNPSLIVLFKGARAKFALWNPDWSYSYQTLQTRNPNKRAKSGTYNLFGWELNYENPEDDDYFGFVHNVGVSMRLPNRSLLTGGYRLTDYEQSFADRQYTHLKLETSYWGHLKPSPFIKLEGNWQEGYDDQIISLGVKQRFRETWGGIDVEFSAGDVKARQSHNSSGYRYMSEITYRPHARRIGQSYFVYAQDFDLNGDHLKNQIIGAGLSFQLSYGRYFGSFSSRYSERKFENIDPFWGSLRKDETINAAIELCRATVRRFSVCLRYAHEETESTIDFYDNEGPDYGLYVRGAVF